jgi:hypothetical protein
VGWGGVYSYFMTKFFFHRHSIYVGILPSRGVS